MLAQCVPEMVQDRLLYQSDHALIAVCTICGLFAPTGDIKKAYCGLCQTSEIVICQMPFGTKLLSNEFNVMNIVPRVLTLPIIQQEIKPPKEEKVKKEIKSSKTLKHRKIIIESSKKSKK